MNTIRAIDNYYIHSHRYTTKLVHHKYIYYPLNLLFDHIMTILVNFYKNEEPNKNQAIHLYICNNFMIQSALYQNSI